MFRCCTVCLAFLAAVTIDAIGFAGVITGTGVNFTGTEGSPTNALVAQFTDPGVPVSSFSATINWGDGTPQSVGTINTNQSGGFNVTGLHTYSEEGTYSPVVNILVGNQVTVLASTAIVADAPLTGNGLAIHGIEGSGFSGSVATFTDANAAAPANDFTATINWGDNSVSVGQIISLGNGQFSVGGSHVYAEEGQFATTVDVSDLGGSSTLIASSATVGDAPLFATGSTISGVEGQKLKGVAVATFTDANPNASTSDFTALINWGDGSSSAGSISSSNGSFIVSGSHTYAEEGSYATSVSVTDIGGSTAAGSGQASVADAPLSAIFSGTFFIQDNPRNEMVAIFSDQNPFGALSDFEATINWGDGATSQGTIISLGYSEYEVVGQHAYASLGSYTPAIQIVDAGGFSTQVTGLVGVYPIPEPGCFAIADAGLVMMLLLRRTC